MEQLLIRIGDNKNKITTPYIYLYYIKNNK